MEITTIIYNGKFRIIQTNKPKIYKIQQKFGFIWTDIYIGKIKLETKTLKAAINVLDFYIRSKKY